MSDANLFVAILIPMFSDSIEDEMSNVPSSRSTTTLAHPVRTISFPRVGYTFSIIQKCWRHYHRILQFARGWKTFMIILFTLEFQIPSRTNDKSRVQYTPTCLGEVGFIE